MRDIFDNIIEALLDLQEEEGVSKSINTKVEFVLTLLEGDDEDAVLANKALAELEVLSENSNIPSHIRTQLFHVVSMLESI